MYISAYRNLVSNALRSGRHEGTNRLAEVIKCKGYGYVDDEYISLKRMNALRRCTALIPRIFALSRKKQRTLLSNSVSLAASHDV